MVKNVNRWIAAGTLFWTLILRAASPAAAIEATEIDPGYQAFLTLDPLIAVPQDSDPLVYKLIPASGTMTHILVYHGRAARLMIVPLLESDHRLRALAPALASENDHDRIAFDPLERNFELQMENHPRLWASGGGEADGTYALEKFVPAPDFGFFPLNDYHGHRTGFRLQLQKPFEIPAELMGRPGKNAANIQIVELRATEDPNVFAMFLFEDESYQPAIRISHSVSRPFGFAKRVRDELFSFNVVNWGRGDGQGGRGTRNMVLRGEIDFTHGQIYFEGRHQGLQDAGRASALDATRSPREIPREDFKIEHIFQIPARPAGALFQAESRPLQNCETLLTLEKGLVIGEDLRPPDER